MKSLFLSIIFAASLFLSNSAQAFITPEEQTRLLVSMNQLNPEQVHFKNIRCSARNRMCLIQMELGSKKISSGCAIEHITGSADLFIESPQGLQLSRYSGDAINECIRTQMHSL